MVSTIPSRTPTCLRGGLRVGCALLLSQHHKWKCLTTATPAVKQIRTPHRSSSRLAVSAVSRVQPEKVMAEDLTVSSVLLPLKSRKLRVLSLALCSTRHLKLKWLYIVQSKLCSLTVQTSANPKEASNREDDLPPGNKPSVPNIRRRRTWQLLPSRTTGRNGNDARTSRPADRKTAGRAKLCSVQISCCQRERPSANSLLPRPPLPPLCLLPFCLALHCAVHGTRDEAVSQLQTMLPSTSDLCSIASPVPLRASGPL